MHGGDDVPLALRQLEVEVNARSRRLLDEEAQRVVESRRLGDYLLGRVRDDELAARTGQDVELDEVDSRLHGGAKRAQRVLGGKCRRAPVPDSQRPTLASLDGDHGVGLVGR